MSRLKRSAAQLLGITMLAACTTPAYLSPVEVTRFVGDAPARLGSGTISVVPASGIDPESLEYGHYAAEVAGELGALGYLVVDSGADQLAVVSLDQSVGQQSRRSPVSVGVGVGAGASTRSYGSGVGLGIGLDLTGQPSETVQTTLAVAIQPSEGGVNLWEGRATFSASANSSIITDIARASDLAASALFTGFPGNSGETIEVE